MSKSTLIEKYRKDYTVADFLVETIDLHFQLSDASTIVCSKMSMVRNSEQKNAGNQLLLNGEGLHLLDIKLDGISLPSDGYYLDSKKLTINDVPNHFVLEIETQINPSKNTSLEGLYKSTDKYCTQCEAEGFRKITYYPDRPDVMARFTTTIEANQEKYPFLLSNGNLIDRGMLENGNHFARWHDPFPKPCYLFALVAGDFDLLEDSFRTRSGREIALKIYVDQGKLNQCQHAMASLKKAMRWDEDVYGLEYDLDIYMIVAVNNFNMGAMENKGLNIFNTCYVLANDNTATDADFEAVEGVIGHEYFHNWTGNRVTCRDWFQLSLKEGLTVFRDQEFSSDMNSRPVKRIEDVQAIKIQQFAEDAGPMSHPIRPDSYIEMNNFYTYTVYNKGAEVIRMIHTLLGETNFQAGMKLYFQRHDGQAVTCEDFVQAMEDSSATDLKLFRNWYRQAGTPKLDIEADWEADSGRYSLKFNQHCKAPSGQPAKNAYLIPLRLALYSHSGDALAVKIDQNDQDINYDISESGKEVILQLTKHHQTIVFSGLAEQPVPSLLRGFTAPVKLGFSYAFSELALLLAHDSDSYSSWEAGQSLMTKVIMDMTSALEEGQQLPIPDILIDALRMVLQQSDKEPSLLALSITVPSLDYLIEQYQQIPFDALLTAYQSFNEQLAIQLKSELLITFHQARKNAKADNNNPAGWRRLQNACLLLLAKSNDDEILNLAIEQFNQATGMTNSLAALTVITHSQSGERKQLLHRFYQRWQDQELVLDKWFAIQGSNPSDSVIDEIYQLFDHADFQLSNPNKVRALVGSFARNNLKNFHQSDGRGYEMVADIVIKLNKINPQIAARLVSSFNGWRHFDTQRQALMKKQLARLLDLDNISADVYEIVSKALK